MDIDVRAALKKEIESTPSFSGLTASAIWDAICSEKVTPGQEGEEHSCVPRFWAMEEIPFLFELEAGLRERAKSDVKAETALHYWVERDTIDFLSPTGVRIVDAMQPTDEQRAVLEALCKRPGKPTVEPPRRLAIFDGRPLGSVEDVKAVLAEIGG